MFALACVFALAFHLANGQISDPFHIVQWQPNAGLEQQGEKLMLTESDGKCQGNCNAESEVAPRGNFQGQHSNFGHTGGFDVQQTVRQALELPGGNFQHQQNPNFAQTGGVDVQQIVQQALQLAGHNVLTTERSGIMKRDVRDDKKFQKKTTKRPYWSKKKATSPPTPGKLWLNNRGKSQGVLPGGKSGSGLDKKFTITPSPRLAQIHSQIQKIRERVRAEPKLGQRAGFGLEDFEKKHKKVVEELKQKQKLRSKISKDKDDDRDNIVGSVHTVQNVKKEEQSHNENHPKVNHKKSEIVGSPQQIQSSSTTAKTSSVNPQEVVSSTTSKVGYNAPKQQVDTKKIISHVKEKIEESKAKLQNRLDAEPEKRKNTLEKNREAVSSTLKQIKEKQEKIKSKFTPSSTIKVDVITQDPKLYHQ